MPLLQHRLWRSARPGPSRCVFSQLQASPMPVERWAQAGLTHPAPLAARPVALGDDLSQQECVTRGDDFGDLLRSLYAMSNALGRMVHQVRQLRQSADSIAIASAEIATGNQDLSARTQQTSSNLQIQLQRQRPVSAPPVLLPRWPRRPLPHRSPRRGAEKREAGRCGGSRGRLGILLTGAGIASVSSQHAWHLLRNPVAELADCRQQKSPWQRCQGLFAGGLKVRPVQRSVRSPRTRPWGSGPRRRRCGHARPFRQTPGPVVRWRHWSPGAAR